MTLRRFLKRLRLKPGDILLIERNSMVRLEKFMLAGRGTVDFNVPIVFHDSKHDVKRMPFEELEQLYLEAKRAHGGL